MAIVDEVRQIISRTLKVPIEQLTPDTRLDDIGAESLDVIEIVFELEEKFDINISFKADDAALLVKADKSGSESKELAFRTIGDISRAVKELVDAKAS